ncbi:hypothetical protein GmHk_01G001226 [Glycine max]|nr:hypothetical protein GmHk_01G001226 [Glycine max]
MEEFLQKVARLGVQPSPLGRGEASVAQEPQPNQEDDILEASKPIPSEPFIVKTSPAIPQEDVAAVPPQVTPQPPPESTTSALDLSSPQLEPSAPVPNLPLSQDSPSGTTALDLNEHAMDSAQDH